MESWEGRAEESRVGPERSNGSAKPFRNKSTAMHILWVLLVLAVTMVPLTGRSSLTQTDSFKDTWKLLRLRDDQAQVAKFLQSTEMRARMHLIQRKTLLTPF